MDNIAIFVSTLGSGGAEKQAALLASVLSKHCNVHFVALYGDSETSDFVVSILKKSEVNVYPLVGSQSKKFKEYASILRSNNVVCSFNYLTKCDFWGAIIAKRCGLKKVYNGIRNSKLDGYKNFLEWISHNFIASGTIFNCYSGEKAFRRKGFRESKCITIPNCFPNISAPLEKTDKGIVRIITVARFHPQKDDETAIKTIALLKKTCKNFVFDLCGYGVLEEQIRGWVKQYDIEDVVEFHIHPNNIPELLRQADIYISTSLFEGTSNSIMEAMNWCLPVVCTNVGDNDKLVLEGENGYLTEIGDAEQLATKLKTLITDNELRQKMGLKSNWHLRENYSMEVFEERYLRVIQK